MLTPEQIEEKIKSKMPEATVRAKDLTGGGDHWQVYVEADRFTGLTLVDQHRLVYDALGEWMEKDIHALSLETKS